MKNLQELLITEKADTAWTIVMNEYGSHYQIKKGHKLYDNDNFDRIDQAIKFIYKEEPNSVIIIDYKDKDTKEAIDFLLKQKLY